MPRKWMTLAEVRAQLKQEARLKTAFESMSFKDQAVGIARLVEITMRGARCRPMVSVN